MYTQIRSLIVTIGSAILAFLSPLSADLYVMLILFGFNAFFGILADIVDDKKWNKKKFQWAFLEALLFVFFVLIIYSIGYIKSNMNGALQCVSFVSYALIYYYGTNITRNLMSILPEESVGHKCFSFIYYVLSIEIIKRIPFLNVYLRGLSIEQASRSKGVVSGMQNEIEKGEKNG